MYFLSDEVRKKYDIFTFHAILLFIHVNLTGKYVIFKNIFVILQR